MPFPTTSAYSPAAANEAPARSLAHQIVFAKRPLTSPADWDRLQRAKTVLEMRNYAQVERGNADSRLRAIQALTEQYDAADEDRRVALAERMNFHRAQYDKHVERARAEEAQADAIERGLEAEMSAASLQAAE